MSSSKFSGLSRCFTARIFVLVLAWASIAGTEAVRAQAVAVRHEEGLTHGFVLLRTMRNETLAVGDLFQSSRRGRVTSQLVLRFKDGSVHEETAIFSQKRNFRLLEYRLVQKGPAFEKPMELWFNGFSGQVSVRSWDEKGKERVESTRMKLPAELANGMVAILVKNIPASGSVTTLSMLVATPKPRMVKLEISAEGEDSFSVGEVSRKAIRFVLKIKLGGVAGTVAPLVGKEPPDVHVWISADETPTFLKSEGPLFEGGPVWRIELASAAWREGKAGSKEK